jgi:hypothetical protein
VSSLTRCNYCVLQDIKREALGAMPRKVVTFKREQEKKTRPGEPPAPVWIGVYVDGSRVASFLFLTETCVC